MYTYRFYNSFVLQYQILFYTYQQSHSSNPDCFLLWAAHSVNNYSTTFYFTKASSLKNSTRGPFGFECHSFTFCYLDFILTPNDPCHSLWWVGWWLCGWGVFLIQFTYFLYINKQNVLISKMFCILLYGFYIKSYDRFSTRARRARFYKAKSLVCDYD